MLTTATSGLCVTGVRDEHMAFRCLSLHIHDTAGRRNMSHAIAGYFGGRHDAEEYSNGGFSVLRQACRACSGALAALQPASYSRVCAPRVRTGDFGHYVDRERAAGGGYALAGWRPVGPHSPFVCTRTCSRVLTRSREFCARRRSRRQGKGGNGEALVSVQAWWRRRRRGDGVGR